MTKSFQTKLTCWLPGLQIFGNYKSQWLSKDLAAGLSVAAIALPVGIAYASLAGLPTISGLYSCILPMIAYALFGTSRQLMVGPDSATCILIASTLAPLAAAGSAHYQSISVLLTIIVGVMCVIAGIAKFGFIANFLSKPILTGYINGLALSIIASQLGKLNGYNTESGGFFKVVYEYFSNIEKTNMESILIGITTFVFLRVFKKYFNKIPAPLFAAIGGIAVVMIFGLANKGVQIVGEVPSGFPTIILPEVQFGELGALISHSLGIVLISYCSAMLTDKSFAIKNNYKIDANKEFIALGAANIFSGLSQGFVISGADSRTAVNDSAGGKTQLVSVVAALTILMVVLFLTGYLTFLPVSTLSAIIISAAIGLFNLKYLKKLYYVSRSEFVLAVITSLSVITIGVLPGVLIALGITLIRLIAKVSKPHGVILGKMDGYRNYMDISEYKDAQTFPGILVYRFEESLLFFNVDYFRNDVTSIIKKEKIKYLVLDASAILRIDITAADILEDMMCELSEKGVTTVITKMKPHVEQLLERSGAIKPEDKKKLFESVHTAVDYCKTLK
ncbi:MAG TPA: SulP family inorganic anion transporter [Ignavibacteria bacterium]|nr:SulP family inorganic anion transporter [Ignavibacteria bacterium]HRB01251.1 SulP family inorganic anion transporter [Ignavibacteria bacterium]